MSADNATLLIAKDGRKKVMQDMMSSYGAVNFGHCNRNILDCVRSDIDIAACFYPEEAYLYSDWICQQLGVDDHKVLFQVGGSFAVSTALSMSLNDRPGKIVALKGSFHGLGLDSLCVTDIHKGYAIQRNDWVDLLKPFVEHVSPGDHIRWKDVSAFIFEPIQGANGYIPVDEEWLVRTVSDAKRAGVVVIADEIQSGYYRHGVLSPSCSMGLAPDIYLFSKSMTNGSFPMSAVVYSNHLTPLGRPSKIYLSHTFQTSAIGISAAFAVSKFIDDGFDRDNLREIEVVMKCVASELKQMNHVKDIYVTGPTLSFGIDSSEVIRRILSLCFHRNVLCFSGGKTGNRIRFAPPVTSNPTIVSEAAYILIEACQEELLVYN